MLRRAFWGTFTQVMPKIRLLSDHSEHWAHLYSAGTNTTLFSVSTGSLKTKTGLIAPKNIHVLIWIISLLDQNGSYHIG